ncbi:hypothetical protein HGA88_03625 [Candidatus Roizmanbacteria bacterium]|nr:hypothetical protein [Candidatus Roizmanbacteria bacterium]
MNELQKQLLDQFNFEKDLFIRAQLLYQLTHDQEIPLKLISEKTNISSSYLCHILRLNRLPDLIRDGYYAEIISPSHLFIISRVKNQTKMVEIYERVLSENLTALKTEELVRNTLYHVLSKGSRITVGEEESFSNGVKNLGKKISGRIIQTRVRSKLTIEISGNYTETTPLLRQLMQKILRNENETLK